MFIFSVIWSLTSYGGINGILFKTDQLIAYLCIIYNLYYFLNLERTDKLLRINSCIICYIACIIYLVKEYLIRRNINPVITYGILRIIWRILSAYGTYLAFKS